MTGLEITGSVRSLTAYHPKLRAHVRVDGDKLHDDLLVRDVDLDGADAALAARLDGTQAWPALRDALIADGHTDHDVDRAMRRMITRFLVEGAGDDTIDRLVRLVRDREGVPISILGGTRFACQGSGECCTYYQLGPISDDDVERLDGLDLATHFPRVAPPYVEERGGHRYLRRVDGGCVFLTADGKCGIHRAFGAEAKPATCRLYPYDAFGTIDGLRIVDRGTCSTFGVSARTGLPLVDDLERVLPLTGPVGLHHPVVTVDGEPWDYGLYLRFTTAAVTLVEQQVGNATDTLHAIGRLLDAMQVVVSMCPIAPGQPDELLDSILMTPEPMWYRPPRREAAVRGARAVGAVLGELRDGLASAMADERARGAAPRFARLMTVMEHAQTVIDLRDADDPPAAWAPDVEDALRISLRQQLFGRHALINGLAGTGLVRIGLTQLLALAAARADAGDRPLTAADLSRGHMLANRSFHTHALDEILAEFEPSWRQLIDGISLAARLVAA